MEASQDRCSLICVDFSLKNIDEWRKTNFSALTDQEKISQLSKMVRKRGKTFI